jgi:nuclease HARBI1
MEDDDGDELAVLVAIAARAHHCIVLRQRTRIYSSVIARFDLESHNTEACEHLFRFRHAEIIAICSNIGVDSNITLKNRCVLPKIEAMCIFLNRLAYPSRLEGMERIFGRQFTVLSRAVKTVMDIIYYRFKHLVSLSTSYVTPSVLESWMAAIRRKGAPLEFCFGFVDGTVRPICRPSRYQKQAYNGHKRVHALKFQSVSAPDGIIIDLTGPWEGRRHDCGMLRESELLQRLEHISGTIGNAYIYGDPAYPISPLLQVPYKESSLSEEESEFNNRMSKVRVSVEWCFGKVISLFPFVDFKKNLKIYLQPVGKLYFVAVLLTNMHTCAYGSLTSTFFTVTPPTLTTYLNIPSSSD